MARGGKREGAGRPKGTLPKGLKYLKPDVIVDKSSEEHKYITPLALLEGIINWPKLTRQERNALGLQEKPTNEQRKDAAKVMAPYVHQQRPKLIEGSVEYKWSDAVKEGEQRVQKLRRQHEQPDRSEPVS